jgi:arylsulfatase A-like enzyme
VAIISIGVPATIALLHRGILPFSDELLSGRGQTALAEYLEAWSPKALLLVLLGGIAFAVSLPAVSFRTVAVPNAPARANQGPVELSLPAVLGIGVWFGLMCGLAEGGVLLVKLEFLHQMPAEFWRLGPESYWLAPLVNALTFTLVSAAVWITWRVVRGQGPTLRGLVTILSGLVIAALAGESGWLHWWASAALATGGGMRLGVLARSSARARRLLTSSGLAGAAITLAVLLSTIVTPMVRERSAWNALPVAPAEAPNVLLVVLDTHRAASMEVMAGTAGTTPQLSQWSKTGFTFDQAFSTASWTLPAHATMFTGRYNVELRTDDFTPLGVEHQTLAEFFAGLGFRTGGFVANLAYTSELFGLSRGFHTYRDHPANLGMALANSWWTRTAIHQWRSWRGLPAWFPEKRATSVNRQFWRWLESDGDRPFFAFLNYFDAHAPYYAPDSYLPDPQRQIMRWYARGTSAHQYSGEELSNMKATYEAGIRYVDHHLGRLLADLELRGILDNTVVFVTSDHGEAFGEHGTVGHQMTLYPEEIHVPLVVLLPHEMRDEVAGEEFPDDGVRILTPVSLRDVPASLADLLNVERSFPGTSMFSSSPPDTILSEHRQRTWAVMSGSVRYIHRLDGDHELYDAAQDPQYMENLIDAPAKAATVERLRQWLEMRLGIE